MAQRSSNDMTNSRTVLQLSTASVKSGPRTSKGVDNLSNAVVRYQGISLAALNSISEALLSKDMMPGTELQVLRKRDKRGFEAGTTIEKTINIEGKGEFMGRIPHVKNRQKFRESSVYPKPREDWTIEDVCEFLVLPDTLKDDSFYLENIGQESVGEPFQGAFVSQSRKTKFHSLVKALMLRFGDKSPSETFVWIDIFCANQPLLTRTDRGLTDETRNERWETLNKGLHEAISNFDSSLIFFDCWEDPAPLKRAWCMWELYGMITSGIKLDIIFDGSASKSLEIHLRNGGGKDIIKAIADIDPQKMECHNPSDLKMIVDAIKGLPGRFSGLKRVVTERLNKWLIESVITVVAAVPKSERNTRDHSELLLQTGIFLLEIGAYKKARKCLEESLRLALTIFDKNDVALVNFYNSLGRLQLITGDDGAAMQFHTMARGIAEKQQLNVRIEHLPRVLNYIGQVFLAKSKYEDAIKVHEEALEVENGSPHESMTFDCLGKVLFDQGKYSEALEYLEKSVEMKKSELGKRHPEIALTYSSMGDAYHRQRKYKSALQMFKKALEIQQETLGLRHSATGITHNNIGKIYESQGRYSAAVTEHEKALQIITDTLGKEHEETALTYNRLGNAYYNLFKFDKALSMHENALAIRESKWGMNHASVAQSYGNIGRVLLGAQEYDKALDSHQKAIEIREKVLGADHPNAAWGISLLGQVYAGQGNYAEALKQYQKAITIIKNSLGDKHASLSGQYNNLGKLCRSQGNLKEALSHHQVAEAITIETGGRSHPDLIGIYIYMAHCYLGLRDRKAAKKYHAMALSIAKESLNQKSLDFFGPDSKIDFRQSGRTCVVQ